MQKRAMEFEKLALEKKKVWLSKYAVLPEAKTEAELVKALDGLTQYVLAERGLPVGIKKQVRVYTIWVYKHRIAMRCKQHKRCNWSSGAAFLDGRCPRLQARTLYFPLFSLALAKQFD